MGSPGVAGPPALGGDMGSSVTSSSWGGWAPVLGTALSACCRGGESDLVQDDTGWGPCSSALSLCVHVGGTKAPATEIVNSEQDQTLLPGFIRHQKPCSLSDLGCEPAVRVGYFCAFCGVFFFCHATWHAGSNPCRLLWKSRVLTAGPPGKS